MLQLRIGDGNQSFEEHHSFYTQINILEWTVLTLLGCWIPHFSACLPGKLKVQWDLMPANKDAAASAHTAGLYPAKLDSSSVSAKYNRGLHILLCAECSKQPHGRCMGIPKGLQVFLKPIFLITVCRRAQDIGNTEHHQREHGQVSSSDDWSIIRSWAKSSLNQNT